MPPLRLTSRLISKACEMRAFGGSVKMCANHAKVAHSTFDRWLKRGELLSDYLQNEGKFNPAESYSWAKTADIWLRELERELSVSNGTLTKEHKACLKLWDEFREATDACVVECLTTIDKAKNIDPTWAEKTLRKFFPDDYEEKKEEESAAAGVLYPPAVIGADQIAGSYTNVYLDILAHRHTTYDFHGGRGSVKSSFISEASVKLIEDNPEWHMLVVRQYATTLRDSVFAQLQWAIALFGHEDRWKATYSPLELTYIPTGQKIYFRGADDPLKIKSIKPRFGAIGILWFEELDQFAGANAVRNIEQSAIRGTDKAYIFKSFNPPQSKTNWANQYVAAPMDGHYRHSSDYRSVPPEWLGQVFIQEAELLKSINPIAYEHEYLGIPNSAGGLVFPNVTLRDITDDEIKGFDYAVQGIDWGFAVDPVHWGNTNYDAKKRTLYIFDEFRALGMGNRELAERLVAEKGVKANDYIIADSAEPKSIDDMNAYNLFVRRADKFPDSVRYSMKWLQSQTIVIDPKRCPYTAKEFTEYEYARTKDGEIISQFPDANNHAIDAVRYATNPIWAQRGK